jgi:transposase
MQGTKRKFTKDFKLKVIQEIEAGKSAAQASRGYQIKDNLIYRWLSEYKQNPDKAFSGKGRSFTHEARVAELERMIGRLTMENELLKKALARLKGAVR